VTASGGGAEDPAVRAGLARLVARDAEVGDAAAREERARRGARGLGDAPYAFPPNTSQVHVTDWVHRPWLSPLRLVYRNLPRPLRRAIKRGAVRGGAD
jgi:hypothetical protein